MCKYVFKRGKNRGVACGKPCQAKNTVKYSNHCSEEFCKDHVNKVMDVQKFPTHIMQEIVASIRDKNHKKEFGRLTNLGATCREYRDIVAGRCEELYKELAVEDEHDHEMTLENMGFKRRLHLLLESGCQRCKCPRITKIHWPFPMRVCQDCIRAITVPEYVLRERYRLPNYTNRRSIAFATWNRIYGDTTYDCFLIKDVEADLNMSLPQVEAAIEQGSHDHKIAIAARLNVPLIELCVDFPRIMQQVFPDEARIVAEFYKHKATKHLAILGYKKSHFNHEHIATYAIRSLANYESFIETLLQNREELEQKHGRQLYDEYKVQLINSLYDLLSSNPYFKHVDLRPICPMLWDRPANETLDELKVATADASQDVLDFIDEHNIDLSCFKGDTIALNLAKLYIKYPKTEPNNVPEFILAYVKSRQKTNTSLVHEFYHINTWQKAITFIKNFK
jgi:hypothetical protein